MTDETTAEQAPATEAPRPDEGDIAADYIEGLLDIADFDGDIEIEQTETRTTIVVGDAGDDFGGLSKPDVVAALQELTRLAVQQQTGEFSRLVLDVAGSRDARALALQSVVDEAAAALAAGAPRVALEPMSSYERKLVHDEVAERGYFSESQGEGKNRRLVIRAA